VREVMACISAAQLSSDVLLSCCNKGHGWERCGAPGLDLGGGGGLCFAQEVGSQAVRDIKWDTQHFKMPTSGACTHMCHVVAARDLNATEWPE
jgi:hypothetical protein